MNRPLDRRPAVSRRDFLAGLGGGIGSVALAHMLAREGAADAGAIGGLHHPAKARRVIQLFMNGGASPMDTFDYKPELDRLHGQSIGPKEKPEGFTAPAGAIMKTPFKFRRYGERGQWVSEVFPHQAQWVDEMAFLMAMASKTNVHGPASFMMNTGFVLPGFPSMGAWISYGLGSLADDLPAFVVLPDPRGLPYNQKADFGAGFLPARHQGTMIHAGSPRPVPDLFPDPSFPFVGADADRDGLAALGRFNRRHAEARGDDSRLEARIASYELAAKMQLSAPEVFDLSRESNVVRKAYGLDEDRTADFGRRCLLARRLIERGTRIVQVWSGPQGAADNWDNHGNIPAELPPMAASVDRPIAALLGDLKARGLLEDTLVVWSTEFGRTPFAQGSLGRDHNGGSFVTWLAGAGIKAGVAHGRSDDLGYQAVEGKTYCYDLHATILHLLGVDHTRLTFRNAGIDRRLTDVHGEVIHEILA
ncbi:MAG: sulfatase [Planctomycetales bacterium 71-10]|nr:MAG: sulfatase [Planctomycetales bacterium 71-10]